MGKARRTNKRNNNNKKKNDKVKETTKTRQRKKQKTKHDNIEEDSNSTTNFNSESQSWECPPVSARKPPIVDSMKIGSSSCRANLRSSKTKNLIETGITNFSRCSRPRKSKEHFASTHSTRQEDESTHQVPQSSRVESPSGYLKQVETSLRHKEIEKGGNGVDEENTEENLLRNYRALEEMMEEEVGEEEVTLAEKPADEDNEAHQVPEGSQRESHSRYLKQMKPTLRCREIEKGGKCVTEENDDGNFLTDKEVFLADKPISMDPYEVVAARVASIKRPTEENLGDGIAVQLPEMMGEVGEKEVLLPEKSIPKVRSRTSSLGLTNFVNMVVGEDDEVDSERCAMDIVKAESMSILRNIQDRHGDIVKNCTASRMLRSEYLQTICDIISQLEGKNLSQIKEDFLLHKIAYVDLIKNKEVDIDWLRNFLVDMLEAKKHLGENFGKLKEKKESTKMIIEEAECKLMECQEQKRELSAKLRELSAKHMEVSDLLRSKCDEEIVCKEALANAKDESTKIAQSIKCVISEAKRFLDCSPVDDLFC